ncbi:hypothetical protein [Zymomonas mobilis]|uniref:Uncharacterized protein n=1 Tax=Zymomonas mobilis subsp. pomaceae (strain ATCC 29192 / DSM 22645 / JCM 10191 / CCUG 17912 / NBRC 13757 / NCIMB 11200 / NRRL B-4491 / Barker I) TaxID=579138 RepID=F8EVD5_ZYMMT|nr:hypothetical protein [Zymomonas mobilis]AEI37342.1 hypothetical protein Zymop_0439 [Zymomonas mobilis subsp. pomaceae ATCC 29192]MDX5948710.1 hypothetical protein [Zymomonas mobilis subsp. pomaceae]GEB88515.1 hypothetical protein ZMO02_01520 [Zymomonas mobilis subsp. pomaceae]
MIITRHFRAICLVGLCCIAALICYMITQRVASERRELIHVERDILKLRQTIRHLQTEGDTLARSGQIDRWNMESFALTSPTIKQFISSDTELAVLDNAPSEAENSASNANQDSSSFRQASYVVSSNSHPYQPSNIQPLEPKMVSAHKLQYKASSTAASSVIAQPSEAVAAPSAAGFEVASLSLPHTLNTRNDETMMHRVSASQFRELSHSKIQAAR